MLSSIATILFRSTLLRRTTLLCRITILCRIPTSINHTTNKLLLYKSTSSNLYTKFCLLDILFTFGEGFGQQLIQKNKIIINQIYYDHLLKQNFVLINDFISFLNHRKKKETIIFRKKNLFGFFYF